MVRISPQQEKALADLLNNKKNYEKRLAQIDADTRVRKAQEREGLAKQVRAALDMGIPQRQVALKGLGYADVGSLKQYLTEQPVSAQPALEPEPEAIPMGLAILPFEGKDFQGDWMVYRDGEPLGDIIVTDTECDVYMINEETDLPQIKELITEKFGNKKWTGE